MLPLERSSVTATGMMHTNGLRILVAEDEFLLSTMLEDDLRSMGYVVVGPFPTVASALQAARSERFDMAILDVNLAGEMVYPLADELTARGIPFLFLTGYGPADLPDRFRSSPLVAKPYDLRLLTSKINSISP